MTALRLQSGFELVALRFPGPRGPSLVPRFHSEAALTAHPPEHCTHMQGGLLSRRLLKAEFS